MIRIVTIASVAVAIGYAVVFSQTQNVWTALNVAGAIAAIGFLTLVAAAVRNPLTPLGRRIIVGLAIVVVTGTAFHWVVMYRMSYFQYHTLHLIHKVIHHGVSLDILRNEGLRTLRNLDSEGTRRGGFDDAFRKNADLVEADSGLVEVKTDSEVRVLVEAESDSEVVLVSLARIRIDGEDPAFRNFDGGIGAVQDRMTISRKGLVYDIEN